MILGPVFWMEMRTGARRARHYATRVFLVSALFAIIVVAWCSFLADRKSLSGSLVGAWGGLTPHELPELGHTIFTAYSIAQFLLIVFLAPLYTAGAVAADRERRVLEMIFTTDLRNVELVASKFLVRTIHLCALALAGVPVMSLSLLLGGVSAKDLIGTITLTISTVVFVSSLGLLISIGSRRAYAAIILLYLTLLVVWLALPVIAAFIQFSGTATSLESAICGAIISLNPMISLMSVVVAGGPSGLWTDTASICSVTYASTSMVLILISILLIRKLGLWASRERVVRRDRKLPCERRSRRVWSNPVAWREVKTIAIHRRMRWARILCLLFSFMISALLWIGWISDWLQGRHALRADLDGLSQVITCTATVAWVLMALQGAVSFTHEREHNTLDALLTAPLTGRHILLGKWQGIMRSSAFALAFPILFTAIAWSRGVTTGRAAVLATLLVLLVGSFAACLGLACSVRFGSSGKACGVAAGILLVLCLGMPLVSEVLLQNLPRRHSWHRVTFLSPSLNLCWAVYDGFGDYRRTGFPHEFWRLRLGKAVGHLVCGQIVAWVLIGWSIAQIETTCRVRQFGLIHSKLRGVFFKGRPATVQRVAANTRFAHLPGGTGDP